MDTGLRRGHLYSACKLGVTYFYEPGDHHPTCSATGFICQLPGRMEFALVTNRHVFDPVWADPEKYEGTSLESVSTQIWLTPDIRMPYQLTSLEPVFHDDDTIDVCAVKVPFDRPVEAVFLNRPLPTGFGDMTDEEKQRDIRALLAENGLERPEDLVPQQFLPWKFLEQSAQYWPTLTVGEMMYFPGFPRWHDKSQDRPVMRSGAIMSDPHTDIHIYTGPARRNDGNQQMLFEAFSTDGNSGSPVFVERRIALLGTAANEPDGHPLIFAGINAGHIEDEQNIPAGASRMHKAAAVLDVLRKVV